LTIPERQQLNRGITKELLGEVLVELGPAARRAAQFKALRELVSGVTPKNSRDIETAWHENVADQRGPNGAGTINLGTPSDAELPRTVRKNAEGLSFSTPTSGAYHAHKHAAEIARNPVLSEMNNYLAEARSLLGKQDGTLRHNQDGSRSVVVENETLRAIVNVDATGAAAIATFGGK
jgi:hypothetical protein